MIHGMTAPGWYPDPGGSPSPRYYDGQRWTERYAQVPVPQKQLNWFFVVLAVLSGVPAAFFGFVFLSGGASMFTALSFLWCAMWAAVWYSLRYR